MSPSVSSMVVVLAVFLLPGLIDRCSSQTIDESEVLETVSRLRENFSSLKKYGLGVETLERGYEAADIRYSSVDSVSSLLSSVDSSRVSNVLAVMDSVVSNTGSQSNAESVADCCSVTSSTSSESCCYGCGGDSTAMDAEQAAGIVTGANLDEEVEFRVGFTDGSVLVYPAAASGQGSCTNEDSRLMSWYNTLTEMKAREVVIFLDLNQEGITGNSSRTALREAAADVIRSLGVDDKVALVVVTDNNNGGCPVELQTATVQVKEELMRFIEESLLTGNRNYPSDFNKAIGRFSSDFNDKLLLLITDGRGDISTNELTTFQDSVGSMLNTNNFIFSIFTANEVDGSNMFLNYLRGFAEGSQFQSIDNIGEYSEVFSLTNSPIETVYITSEFNRNNELSLSMSRVWKNDTIVGVVNVLLPWRYVMSEVADATEPRPSSYYFVLTQQGDLLYHEQFSGINVVDLSPRLFETENIFSSSVLSSVTSGQAVSSVAVDKTTVVNYDDQVDHRYIDTRVPSSYTCALVVNISNVQVAGDGLMHACVVMATEDANIVDSFEVSDVESVYRGNPSRVPVYNTQLSSLTSCHTSCLLSIEDRYSIQFTDPVAPPIGSTSDIVSYLIGMGTRQIDLEEGLVEELAVVSTVGPHWISNQFISEVLSLKRRHLTTPTGIFLSFPAVELNTSLVPRYLPWYVTAVANGQGTLSLSPARNDSLDQIGMVYTASYPVIVNGTLLSVLMADASVDSLRTIVNEASEGTCGQSGYDCSIMNTQGDFVLPPTDYPSADNIYTIPKYFSIIAALHNNISGPLFKLGCNDILSTDTDHRIYYKLSLNESVQCYTPDLGCFDFCVSSITDTDSFFLQVKMKSRCSPEPIRQCGQLCFNCDDFNTASTECPCSCQETTCETVSDFNLPVCPARDIPPSNYDYGSTESSVGVTPCHQDMCCGYGQSECVSSPSCNWCSTQSTCLLLGACCTGDTSCCRDNGLPICLLEYCIEGTGNKVCVEPSPTPSESPDSSSGSDQAAIIGGVIGGVFGIFLLAILIILCVWYQLVNKDRDSSQSKERSEFNFTDMKVSSTNKTAIELKGVEPLQSPNGQSTEKPLPSPADGIAV